MPRRVFMFLSGYAHLQVVSNVVFVCICLNKYAISVCVLWCIDVLSRLNL